LISSGVQVKVTRTPMGHGRTSLQNPRVDDGELLDEAIRKVSKETDILIYEIVIPISEVQSVNVFDLDIYERFFAPMRSTRKTMKRR
jgi:hypothetical protein